MRSATVINSMTLVGYMFADTYDAKVDGLLFGTNEG